MHSSHNTLALSHVSLQSYPVLYGSQHVPADSSASLFRLSPTAEQSLIVSAVDKNVSEEGQVVGIQVTLGLSYLAVNCMIHSTHVLTYKFWPGQMSSSAGASLLAKTAVGPEAMLNVRVLPGNILPVYNVACL